VSKKKEERKPQGHNKREERSGKSRSEEAEGGIVEEG